MSYKILVINWQDIRNPLGGGAEVHFHEIFKRIAQRGHQVTLLCCGFNDLPDEEIVDGIHVIRRGNRYCFNYLVPVLYRKYSRQTKFDIVVDGVILETCGGDIDIKGVRSFIDTMAEKIMDSLLKIVIR